MAEEGKFLIIVLGGLLVLMALLEEAVDCVVVIELEQEVEEDEDVGPLPAAATIVAPLLIVSNLELAAKAELEGPLSTMGIILVVKTLL